MDSDQQFCLNFCLANGRERRPLEFHVTFVPILFSVEEVVDPIFVFQITHGLTPPSWNTEEMMNTISTELIPFQYYIDFGTTEKAKLKVTAEAV